MKTVSVVLVLIGMALFGVGMSMRMVINFIPTLTHSCWFSVRT